jgi:AMP deaminase
MAPMATGSKVTSAQSWQWGVKEGARLYGCMPVEGEVVDKPHFAPPSFSEFRADYEQVTRLTHWAPAKSFSYRRLKLLESRFQLHKILNSEVETGESKRVPHRDFYNVRKVDTHVHHSACMTQKHLLRFIKHKLKKHPGDVVKTREGKPVTLAQVFQELGLTAYDLSIDTLDMHADNTFHRFDRFNLKYSPIGQSILREVFLKTDNHIGGRYLAEITRQVFDDLESSKYQLAEYRLSIYGRRPNEWGKLARWAVSNRLASRNVRWMIQIPRLYQLYKKQGLVTSFQDMLDNIFMPLWDVSIDPSCDPQLHDFLTLVVGVDMVDDESKQESSRDAQVPAPEHWTAADPPPYYYWVYYINANLNTLNHFRASRGLSVLSFRPHAGEAGDVDHLSATFLTAEGVNHGITMRKHVTLQYLYYLSQIGLAMSPLSNNKLFIDYHSNPFYTYFERGLNVSLSTDAPALFHYTREPLVEEYCVAAQVWKLNSVDMCEIARNSVLQSGFEHPFKAYWIGKQYSVPGPRGSDIHLTNVPNIRLQYRFESLIHEHSVVQEGAGTMARLPMALPPADTRSIKGVQPGAASSAQDGTGLNTRSAGGQVGGRKPLLSPSTRPVVIPKESTPTLALSGNAK